MAGEPLVLTTTNQLNTTRQERRRFGATTTRRQSRRLPSRVPGEPETRGAPRLTYDLSAGTSTVPDGSAVCLRIAPTGAIESVLVKAAPAHDIDVPGQLVDGA